MYNYGENTFCLSTALVLVFKSTLAVLILLFSFFAIQLIHTIDSKKIIAYGYDSKNRKQVIYNPKFILKQNNAKFKKIKNPNKWKTSWGEEYTPKDILDENRDKYIELETERRYEQYDHTLQGMDRRARTAEIILALVIVFILNCACISYCKMYNKKKNSEVMQA